jgi:hypothetical protein
MNKDALLASIIGFFIGLCITGGVILGPKLLSQLKQPAGQVASLETTGEISPSITPSPVAEDQTLTIDRPKKEEIVNEPRITVSGKAPPRSILIIGSSEDEKVVETGDNTTYEATIALKEGKNDITVARISENKPIVERVTIYVKQ